MWDPSEGPFQVYHTRKSSLAPGNLGEHVRAQSSKMELLEIFWAGFLYQIWCKIEFSFLLRLVYLSHLQIGIISTWMKTNCRKYPGNGPNLAQMWVIGAKTESRSCSGRSKKAMQSFKTGLGAFWVYSHGCSCWEYSRENFLDILGDKKGFWREESRVQVNQHIRFREITWIYQNDTEAKLGFDPESAHR